MSSLFSSTLQKVRRLAHTDLSKLTAPIEDMLLHNWYLGLTSFGGPAVHFQIFRRKFVDKTRWIDDQMYKEMFSLCQALPGPGSTKMIYAINIIHGGFVAGMLSFFIWSLPMAIAAYGLAIGVSQIKDTLPAPAFALLSGLNAATVGIIALAAVQLSEKAITDKLTRLLVFLGGSAGVLYNALWYYPVLMVAGGTATIIWDYQWGHKVVRASRSLIFGLRNLPTGSNEEQQVQDRTEMQDIPPPAHNSASTTSLSYRPSGRTPPSNISVRNSEGQAAEDTERVVPVNLDFRIFSWKFGIAVVGCFLVSFVAVMILRSVLISPPFGFRVFSNLFLAGTIIFGGGPVVIPLLQQYVVVEGWVSPRDFLLGLAIIQAFPGPNFNFAVYLGALAVTGQLNPAAGALIGYIAIFSPGIVLHTGTMGLWKEFRNRRWFTSALRGINAVAVGLIYSAVYRLWQQGLLSKSFTSGSSLGLDPWWLCVTATSFVGGRWFNVSAPIAIILGGVMGMVWYGVVTA